MTQRQYMILALLILVMAASAISMGRWAQGLNPDGIVPNTPVAATDAQTAPVADSAVTPPVTEARNAFTFGASMGLLGIGLLYCVVAAGLLLQAKSKALPANRFIYAVAGLAVTSFALSYLIDDYFY